MVGGTDCDWWVAPIAIGGWHRLRLVGGTDCDWWVAPIAIGGWHRLQLVEEVWPGWLGHRSERSLHV